MRYFVVVPGALVPAPIAPRLLARATLPALSSWLQRAGAAEPRRLDSDGAAHLDWLWSQFGDARRPAVTAPYAWRALNRASALEVADETPLWHADPLHFAFARDHMLVTTLDGDAALTPEESQALAADAAAIMREFDATLRVIGAAHWFVAFEPAWELATVSLDGALGRSAQNVLPWSAQAARWRKLLNEIQMSWHQHPVNAAREDAGKRTVNGLWLHGGGVWQALPRRPYDAVCADDPAIRGWALASGVAPNAVTDSATKPARAASALVYLPGLLRAATQEDWDAWLEAAAVVDAAIADHVQHAFEHGFGEVTLLFAGREVVRSIEVRASDRLRFWRHNRIADLFAEAEPA